MKRSVVRELRYAEHLFGQLYERLVQSKYVKGCLGGTIHTPGARMRLDILYVDLEGSPHKGRSKPRLAHLRLGCMKPFASVRDVQATMLMMPGVEATAQGDRMPYGDLPPIYSEGLAGFPYSVTGLMDISRPLTLANDFAVRTSEVSL